MAPKVTSKVVVFISDQAIFLEFLKTLKSMETGIYKRKDFKKVLQKDFQQKIYNQKMKIKGVNKKTLYSDVLYKQNVSIS